jgi:hypothetical protein
MNMLIDPIFPEEYQPLFPIKINTKSNLFSSQYGKGLDNVVRFGINQIEREFVVRYELPTGDADFVDSFLNYLSLYKGWFWWSAGDITGPEIRVRCEQWTKTLIAHNWSSISATFIETFEFAGRKRGIEVYSPSSYFVSFKPATVTTGFHVGGAPPSFQLTLQSNGFIRGYHIYGATASYNVNIVKAGPEFFNPLIGETVAYAIAAQDIALYRGIGSDYFSDMSAQLYGWDRDFQVDWWGD